MQELKEEIREIRQSITAIDKTLAVNTESLVHHVKRTDLLEKLVLMLVGAIVVAVLGGVIKLLIS